MTGWNLVRFIYPQNEILSKPLNTFVYAADGTLQKVSKNRAHLAETGRLTGLKNVHNTITARVINTGKQAHNEAAMAS